MLDYLRHALTALTHLQDLLLLLVDVVVEVVLHLSIQHWLPVRVFHQSAELVLDSLQLVHLCELLLFHLFMLEELFTLLEDVFPHLHCLLEVLIPVLENLF